MLITWNRDKGWAVFTQSLEDTPVIVPATTIKLLGDVRLSHSERQAWAECDGYKEE